MNYLFFFYRSNSPDNCTDDSRKCVLEKNVNDEVSEILRRLQANAKNVTISKAKVNKTQNSFELQTNSTESETQQPNNSEEKFVDNTEITGKYNECPDSDDVNFDGFDNDYEPDYVADENESSASSEISFESDDEDYKPSKKTSKIKQEKEAKKTKPGSSNKRKMSTNHQKEKVVVIKLTADPVYICMTCRGKFESFEILKAHMKGSNECKLANSTCEVCGKVFEKRKSLYQHSLTHREKEAFVCDQCGKVYTNRFNLENHKSSQHGEYVEENGSIYKCKMCDTQFTNRTDLYAHINDHSKIPVTLLCDTCGKCFRSAERLRAHKRLHMNIRPFHCTYCPKHFRSRLQLTQHLHVHTGIKSFSCTFCSKAFAKKESLVSHKRLHTGETPYECSVCFEKFISINKLKTHGKQHCNEGAVIDDDNEKVDEYQQSELFGNKFDTEIMENTSEPSTSYVTYVSDYLTTSNVIVIDSKLRGISENGRNDNIRLIQL